MLMAELLEEVRKHSTMEVHQHDESDKSIFFSTRLIWWLDIHANTFLKKITQLRVARGTLQIEGFVFVHRESVKTT